MRLDTVQLVIRLPPKKLERTKKTLAEWWSKKACKKRDLLQL